MALTSGDVVGLDGCNLAICSPMHWLTVTKSLSGRGFRHERKPETNEFHAIAMWDSSGLSLTTYDPCMVHLFTYIYMNIPYLDRMGTFVQLLLVGWSI